MITRHVGGNRSLIALVVIVGIGFGIRARGLENFQLTHWDEGAIWLSATWLVTLGTAGVYRFTSPPLPPLLFGVAARPFGLAPAASIWMSVLAGTACIVVMYMLVGRLSSFRAGLIAAGLLALSGLHVMYSRLLLTEPFYVLFLLTSLLCSVEYVRTRALRWLIATAVGASCLQLTKYNGCLVAVPLLAVLACEAVTGEYGEERSRAFRHGLILGGIVAGTIVSNVAVLTAFGVFSRFIRTYSGYIRGEPVSPAGLVQYLQLVTPLPVLYLAIAGMAYAAWARRSISWAIVHLGFILYVAFTFIYTFYLRLLAPLSVFLIIYASLVIDALFSSRARVAHVATLMIAVLFGFDTWRDFSRYVVRDFSGYSRASALLNGLGDGAPVLMLTQHNVWRELTRTVSFLPNAPPDEIVIPPDAHHVYLVTDLYAYYKYGHRQYVSRLASLQDRLVARIPNPLVYEPVENQLTILELVRLETDRALRDQLFSISVFRLTPSEARDALTSGESKMPRDAAETFVGGRAAR